MRINEKEKKGYDRYFQLPEVGGGNSNEVLAIVVVLVVGAVGVVRMRTSRWVKGPYNSPRWNCWNLWLDAWLSNLNSPSSP